MVWIGSYLENFPAEYPVAVTGGGPRSSSISKRERRERMVADADSITANGNGTTHARPARIAAHGRRSRHRASTLNVSASAEEYNSELSANGTTSLAQATSERDRRSHGEGGLDVPGFDTLKALISPTHVNVVDAVSNVTGYTGDLTVVNRVT